MSDRIKASRLWASEHERELGLTALVILISLASFGLGRLSSVAPRGGEATILKAAPEASAPPETALPPASVPQVTSKPNPVPTPALIPDKANLLVASKNGKAYHLPTCPGAKQIKEENKIYFKTTAEAEAAGYQPAANCPGLK